MKLLWVSGHCTTLPSDDKWWEGFDDLVLTRLVRLGETNSFNISMALHRIEMARPYLRREHALSCAIRANYTKYQVAINSLVY